MDRVPEPDVSPTKRPRSPSLLQGALKGSPNRDRPGPLIIRRGGRMTKATSRFTTGDSSSSGCSLDPCAWAHTGQCRSSPGDALVELVLRRRGSSPPVPARPEARRASLAPCGQGRCGRACRSVYGDAHDARTSARQGTLGRSSPDPASRRRRRCVAARAADAVAHAVSDHTYLARPAVVAEVHQEIGDRPVAGLDARLVRPIGSDAAAGWPNEKGGGSAPLKSQPICALRIAASANVTLDPCRKSSACGGLPPPEISSVGGEVEVNPLSSWK